MQRTSAMAVLGGREIPRSGRVHVVGLGGSGVRSIVPLLMARGATVSGSDKDDSPVLDKFRDDGVECWVGHANSNVDPETDVIVVSAAVHRDNPEIQAAQERSIPVVKYAECLGLLMRDKQGICIAGTHGKTTTSAMTSFVLLHAGCDPSFVIGGEHPDLGGGSRSGTGEHFVAEACEYDHSFLNLAPKAAVVTNIEEDHLDYFGSLDDIRNAFRSFVRLLPEDGLLVYNQDDPNSLFLKRTTKCRYASFGLRPGKSDWWAEDIRFGPTGTQFVLCGPNGWGARVRLRVPGVHNIRNALACAAACSWAGVPFKKIVAALGEFRGVRRRFDVLREEPCTVIDDYAHHPTEVEAVVRSARQSFPDSRIVAVFQPHQYSRLRNMLNAFADALQGADDVIITEVYRARDTDEDVRAVSGTTLAEAVRHRGTDCLFADSFSRAIGQLEGIVRPKDVVLFLGAGSITDLAACFSDDVASGAASLRGGRLSGAKG